MSSFNQSNMNDSRNTSRLSGLFSNRTLDDTMASRQSRENSLISTNRYKSPFYEGKVSFGGSSGKRVRLSKILPYNIADKPSNVTRIKDSDIKRLNEFDQLSNATKSVLEKICKASSPIEDAKRIPIFSNQSTEKFMIDMNSRPFKRLSSTRTPFTVPAFKTTSPMDREKLQLRWEELEHSSSQSLNSSLQNINNQNILIANAGGSYYHQQQQKLNNSSVDQSLSTLGMGSSCGGKMRAKISRTHRSNKWTEDDQLQPEYDLPKNVSLPINSNSLPIFNLNKKSMQPQQFKSTDNTVSRSGLKRTLVSVTQEDDSWDSYDEFKFSAPKAIKLDKISDSFLKDSIRKDTVESSKSLITDKNNLVEKIPTTTTDKITEFKTTLQQPSLATPTSQIKPSTDSINVETNKTVGMFTVDKIDNDFNPKENKATLANTNLAPIKSIADTKLSNTFNYDGLHDFTKSTIINAKRWTCDTCDVKNELSVSKCVACEQPRLKEVKDKNINNIYSNYSFNTINLEKKSFNAFKLDSKTTVQQSTTTSAPTIVSSNSSFLSNTLSNNTSNSNKIELNPITDKTLVQSESQPNSETTTLTTLNSNSKTNATESTLKPFNFITNEVADQIEKDKQALKSSNNSWGNQFLPPKGNWSCPSCMTSNQSTHKKCPCCETSNPNLSKELKDSNKTDIKSGLSFTDQSTGGFKFSIPPTTYSSSTAITTTAGTTTNFSFNNKLTNTTTSKDDNEQGKGFSFASLAPSVTSVLKSDNQIQTDPLFTFGASSVSNLNSIAPTTNTSSKAIGLVETEKQSTPSLNDSNKSSNFSSTIAPSFNFGSSTKDSSTVIKNEPSLKKPVSDFSFVSNAVSTNPPPTSNLNNGGITFSLPLQTNQQPQSTGLFTSANNTISNFNSFSSQFGNKTQSGLSFLGNQATSQSSNLFSPPINQLSNGFVTPVTDNNNLFSNSTAALQTNNQAPATNFAFPTQVPSTFSFGSNDQSQNSNVFQFAAKTDTPIGVAQMKAAPHGRCIKKAKRRLGSKD